MRDGNARQGDKKTEEEEEDTEIVFETMFQLPLNGCESTLPLPLNVIFPGIIFKQMKVEKRYRVWFVVHVGFKELIVVKWK